MLCAIVDDEEEVLNIDPERDLDFVLTFECDGVRYQRKVGDCDGEHIQAIMKALKIEPDDIKRLDDTINRLQAKNARRGLSC